MRGRLPEPTQLKVLKGVHESRINRNEPNPRPVKPKKAPWLDKLARREWNRMCKLLEPLGLLSEIDGAALGIYCQAFSRLKQAEDAIVQGGMTYEIGGQKKQRPEILIAEKAMKIIRMIAIEFGMTPSSRGRIEVKVSDEEEDEDLD